MRSNADGRSLALHVSVVFVVLVLMSICGSGWAQTGGVGSLSAREVLEAARARHVPDYTYRVRVNQRVVQGGTAKGAVEATSFEGDAEFVPGEGLKRVTQDESTPLGPVGVPAITVDIEAFIKEMLAYDALSIEMTEIEGQSHYRVEGRSEGDKSGCIVWIDNERKTVSRLLVRLLGKPFATIDLEYAVSRNGFWLPRAITLTHATDNSVVVLEFSDYQFEE